MGQEVKPESTAIVVTFHVRDKWNWKKVGHFRYCDTPLLVTLLGDAEEYMRNLIGQK